MRAIRTDYRPNWDLGNTWQGQPTLDGGRVLLVGIDTLAPGEEGPARIDPLMDEAWGLLEPGRVLPMQEGVKVVGHAFVQSVTRPPHLTREVAAFVLEAHQFCHFVEKGSSLPVAQRLRTARGRLLDLYRAGAALPSFEPIGTDDAPPTRRPDWVGFGETDVYSEVFDPYDDSPSLVAGSLSDDVLEIYADVSRGLGLWESKAHVDAVWEWRFGFDTHWGDHAIDALRALHRACARET